MPSTSVARATAEKPKRIQVGEPKRIQMGEPKRIQLREFRKNISHELYEVFSGRSRLLITKNNDERAGVIPVQMMKVLDQIGKEIDLATLMTHAEDKDEVFNAFFKYFVQKIKSVPNELNKDSLEDLKNYYLDHLYSENYPQPEHKMELAKARELSVIGTNLRRIIPFRFGELQQVLERQGTVCAIFIDPDSDDAVKYSSMQEMGNANETALEYQRNLIKAGRDKLVELSRTVKAGKVIVYKIDYPLAFGLDVIDGETDEGIIYVRYFPFADDGQPILKLTRKNEVWYKHYLFQLHRLKSVAKVWRNDQP